MLADDISVNNRIPAGSRHSNLITKIINEIKSKRNIFRRFFFKIKIIFQTRSDPKFTN